MLTTANSDARDFSAASSPAKLGTWLRRLAWIAGYIWLALTFFDFPRFPGPGLDPSWRMVLYRSFASSLQFGRDIVFTYGPLGFATARTYVGEGWWWMLGWQMVASLALAGFICAGALEVKGPLRIFYFIYFGLLAFISEESLHLVIIGVAAAGLVRATGPRGSLMQYAAAAIIGCLSLVKFTNVLLAGITMAVVVAHHLQTRRRHLALRLAGVCAGTFLAGWLMAGQNPMNLPRFLWNSWEIAAGYAAAMGVEAPQHLVAAGAGIWLMLVLYAAVFVWTHADRSYAAALSAIFLSLAFLSWKHSFTRADLFHTTGFFAVAALPVTGFALVLGRLPPRWHTVQLALLAAIAVMAAGGLWLHVAPWQPPNESLADPLKHHLLENVHRLGNLGATRAEYERHWADERKEVDLPQTRAVVGQATLDILGIEQNVALFNGFNYHPRPVFQSYSAYTPRLAELNRAVYDSPNAPKYVLQKLQPIDDRLATMDDGVLLAQLVHDYRLLFEEMDFALWERLENPPPRATTEPRRKETRVIEINERTAIDETQDLWVTIEVTPSLLGRLWSLLYRPAGIRIRLESDDGMSTHWTLPQPVARAGFILNPLIDTLPEYLAYAKGDPSRRVKSLAVVIAPEDEKFFARRIKVNLYNLAPIPAQAVKPLAQ